MCLDAENQFLEKGDMVGRGEIGVITYHHYVLIGLVVGPGRRARSADYYYNKVTVLWENGDCEDIPPDHLTIVQKGRAERRTGSIPPLSAPRPDKIKRRGPKQ